MSNDKAAATYHGRKRAFKAGDWVYVTQLPEYDHRLGQVDEVTDSMFPYLVRFDGGEQYGAFDWLALTPAPSPLEEYLADGVHPLPGDGVPAPMPETTGEHIFHKLGDDLYQDWEPKHRVQRPAFPTVGELGLALGIIAAILFVFVFVVFFYRGW